MVVVNGMKPFWLMTSLGVYAGRMGKSTGVEVRIVIMYLRPRKSRLKVLGEDTEVFWKDTEVFWNNGRSWV